MRRKVCKKRYIFAKIWQNLMSLKYFSKNGPFASHVAESLTSLVKKNWRKSQHLLISAKFSLCIFSQAIFVKLRKTFSPICKNEHFLFQSKLPILQNSKIINSCPYYKTTEVIMNLLAGSCPDPRFQRVFQKLRFVPGPSPLERPTFSRNMVLYNPNISVQAGDHMAAPTVEQVIRTNR